MLLNLGKYRKNYRIFVYKHIENSNYGEQKTNITHSRKG